MGGSIPCPGFHLRKGKAKMEITLRYIDSRELAAMDALLVSAGFSAPALRSRTFMAHSRDYRDHRILGAAYTTTCP